MSVESHLQSLSEKRRHLKARIAEEMARPMPDFVLITGLKKQNLALKQEMQECYELRKKRMTG